MIDWKEAEERLKMVEETTLELATMSHVNIHFYAGQVAQLRSRFDKGERSNSLCDDIMEME